MVMKTIKLTLSLVTLLGLSVAAYAQGDGDHGGGGWGGDQWISVLGKQINIRNGNGLNWNDLPQLEVTCELVVDNNISDLRPNGQYIANPAFMATKKVNGFDQPITSSTRFAEYFLVRTRCRSNYGWGGPVWYQGTDLSTIDNPAIEMRYELDLLPRCQDVQNGFCRDEYLYRPDDIEDYKPSPDWKFVPRSEIMVYVKGDFSGKFNKHRLSVTARRDSTATHRRTVQQSYSLGNDLSYTGIPDNSSCRLIVSGAKDPSAPQVPSIPVVVTPGRLEFTAVIENSSVANPEILSAIWSGGPDSNGRWSNPPPRNVSSVSARLEVRGKSNSRKTLTCSLQVLPQGDGPVVKLSKYSDCSFFASTRNYYFLDKNNKAVNLTPYKVKYPGIDAIYNDVPFRGVLNGAVGHNGEVNIGINGAVEEPPLDKRKYSKAVIVAKIIDAKTKVIQEVPIYYATMPFTNYSITEMIEVGDDPGDGFDKIPLKDSDTIVFQAFLARIDPDPQNPDRDRRGTASNPYFLFSPDGGPEDPTPYDRIIPLTDDSCVPLFQVPIPEINGKPLPAKLKSAVTCTYSRPYTVGDLKGGRVRLNIMHFTPEYPTQHFPLELIRSAHPTQCKAVNPGDTTPCWNVKASAINQNAKDPYSNHLSCRKGELIDKPQTVCSGKSKRRCVKITVPTWVYSFDASCNVIEDEKECGANLAVRFSGYAQMATAALGCAVKYGRPDELVTATLRGEGILPYTTFGGATPQHYANYPASKAYVAPPNVKDASGKLVRPAPTPPNYTPQTGAGANGARQGYACIPCRFANDESRLGYDIFESTARLPVDQDADVARKPIYSYSRSIAPKECVKNINFEIRYFGSSACNGVNTPPNHFCVSENIGNQNCGTSDVSSNAANGGFVGGGNIAGKFSVPVCPGSEFEYENISVSWSPIIVDITGNGISISRSFNRSVLFDIKGTGNKVKVDWPINVKENAFLVRPDKKGKVTSIQQLFGDYKAKNGFEALKAYDSDKDGFVSTKDKRFKELALWLDKNRDGIAQDDEIKTLAEYGVDKISTHYTKPLTKGIEGKTLNAQYFNTKYNQWLNVEDHYFYEYQTLGQRVQK